MKRNFMFKMRQRTYIQRHGDAPYRTRLCLSFVLGKAYLDIGNGERARPVTALDFASDLGPLLLVPQLPHHVDVFENTGTIFRPELLAKGAMPALLCT